MCPQKTLMVPCLHDEPFAYVNIMKNAFNAVSGFMFNSVPEMDTLNVHVIPNPATDQIRLSRNVEAQVQVMDLAGRQVLATQHLRSGQSLQVAELPRGIYLLAIEIEGQSTTVRFQKD